MLKAALLALVVAVLVAGCGSSAKKTGSSGAPVIRDTVPTIPSAKAEQAAKRSKSRLEWQIPDQYQGVAVDVFAAAADQCSGEAPEGATEAAAVRRFSRRAQRTPYLRAVASAGCREGINVAWGEGFYEPAIAAPSAEPSPEGEALSPDEIKIYQAEYVVCQGITVADIRRDYGFDTVGMTPEEVILEMERQSYDPADQPVAYEACLDGYYGKPSKH
jgi:hypothetical protein